MTWTAIMVSASHWVGLTLPGMIDEPGSFSGIASSANPARGPHDISRMSLAILYRDTASVRSVPDSWTSASWAPWTVNLLGAETNGRPVRRAISLAAASANPGAELIPVPTAVPPSARRYTPSSAVWIRSTSSASIPAYPDHSCPSVSGVASCMWVRPILTLSPQAFALAPIAARTAVTPGTTRCVTFTAAAMYMADGNESFDDWAMFT